MHERYPHPSVGGRSFTAGRWPTSRTAYAGGETDLEKRLDSADRACCCLAKPLVVAIIPPTADRPEPADLLLCGHHYTAYKDALEAVGATIHDSRVALAEAEPDWYGRLPV